MSVALQLLRNLKPPVPSAGLGLSPLTCANGDPIICPERRAPGPPAQGEQPCLRESSGLDPRFPHLLSE